MTRWLATKVPVPRAVVILLVLLLLGRLIAIVHELVTQFDWANLIGYVVAAAAGAGLWYYLNRENDR